VPLAIPAVVLAALSLQENNKDIIGNNNNNKRGLNILYFLIFSQNQEQFLSSPMQTV
jgi:hypothetical protein